MARRSTRVGTEAVRFIDPKTKLITKRLFYLLLPEGGVENQEVLRLFEVDLGSRSEEEARMIRGVSDKIREVINSTDLANVDGLVQDFHSKEWNITHANMHAEFQRVSSMTFEEINWGRIVGFLAFAISFGVYLLNLGLPPSAVESVNAWTNQMIERDLGQFFVEHDGWEGCLEFSTTLLTRLRRTATHQADNGREPQQQTFWQSVAAVGALGFGALVAFSVRQALS